MPTPRRIRIDRVARRPLAAPARALARELLVDADHPVYLIELRGRTSEPLAEHLEHVLGALDVQAVGIDVPIGHELEVFVLDLPAPGDPGPAERADHTACTDALAFARSRLAEAEYDRDSLHADNAQLRTELVAITRERDALMHGRDS